MIFLLFFLLLLYSYKFISNNKNITGSRDCCNMITGDYLQTGIGNFFITFLFSNIFLSLVNRSFKYTIFKTITYKNNLVAVIIGISLLFIASFIYVPFVRDLFRLNILSLLMIAPCLLSIVNILWINVWKLLKLVRNLYYFTSLQFSPDFIR